jgi:hypothetical protein
MANTEGTEIADGGPVPSGGAWTTIMKTADQSISSNTTPANDNTLYFSMSSGHVYQIRGAIYFGFASGGGGAKLGFTGPTGTIITITAYTGLPNSGTPGFNATLGGSGWGSYAVAAADYGTMGSIIFTILVDPTTASGTFAFQWSQNVSETTATTVYAGSYIEYMVH